MGSVTFLSLSILVTSDVGEAGKVGDGDGYQEGGVCHLADGFFFVFCFGVGGWGFGSCRGGGGGAQRRVVSVLVPSLLVISPPPRDNGE